MVGNILIKIEKCIYTIHITCQMARQIMQVAIALYGVSRYIYPVSAVHGSRSLPIFIIFKNLTRQIKE